MDIQTIATHCIVCGRPLEDARSVLLGIGPECGEILHDKAKHDSIPENVRKELNRIVLESSIAAARGDIEKVKENAVALTFMGYDELAGKIKRRFRKAEKNVKITISTNNDYFIVYTPFKRSKSREFITAWRSIPGRRYKRGHNWIPKSEKRALWQLLRKFFPGTYGESEKGIFKVPK